MQYIFTHLTYLLTEHDCVVIPGFGGFVVHREEARYLKDEDIFTPPAYTIGFNEQLRHNDGLLINLLTHTENIDYKAAQKELEAFTEDLKNRLDSDNAVAFPGIGEISVSAEGNYRFVAAKETDVNAAMYGLSEFHLPLLSELYYPAYEQEPVSTGKGRSGNVILIPVSKRLIKSVASAAAIIIAILMISSPIDNLLVPTQYASIINSDIIRPAAQFILPEAPVQSESATAKSNETPALSIQPAAASANTAEVLPTEQANKITRLYYIIVAGTSSQSRADKLLDTIQNELFPKADIIEKDNMSRIYIAKFSDKKEAEIYLDDFRAKNPKYDDAWLLSVRQP